MRDKWLEYITERLFWMELVTVLSAFALIVSLMVWPEEGICLGFAIGCVISSLIIFTKWWKNTGKIIKMATILGGAWERKTPEGRNYMEATIGSKRYLLVANGGKLKPEQEDFLTARCQASTR